MHSLKKGLSQAPLSWKYVLKIYYPRLCAPCLGRLYYSFRLLFCLHFKIKQSNLRKYQTVLLMLHIILLKLKKKTLTNLKNIDEFVTRCNILSLPCKLSPKHAWSIFSLNLSFSWMYVWDIRMLGSPKIDIAKIVLCQNKPGRMMPYCRNL